MQKEMDLRIVAAALAVVLAVVGWFAWRTFGPKPPTPMPGGLPTGMAGASRVPGVPGGPPGPVSVDALASKRVPPNPQ
jgi:hypothetical protein